MHAYTGGYMNHNAYIKTENCTSGSYEHWPKELYQTNKNLTLHNTHDGVFNSHFFTKDFMRRNDMQTTQGKSTAPSIVIIVKIDNFNDININYGYNIGDTLLETISSNLALFLPKGSCLFRRMGGEYMISLRKNTVSSIESFAEKLLEHVKTTNMPSEIQANLTASIGIAEHSNDSFSIEKLTSRAGLALRKAKETKNSYYIYNQDIQEESKIQHYIEHNLVDAIRAEEIFMVFQPQLKTDGTLYGVEALVRWDSPAYGFIPPDVFIPVIEKKGQMVQLGNHIINQSACGFKQIQGSLLDGQKDFNLSINISIKQLLDPAFKDNFLAIINDHCIRPNQVTLEITETVFIEHIQDVVPMLKGLESHGITVSLDDFGTGFSSLAVLPELPIAELKIDKSFLVHSDKRMESCELLKAIIQTGKQLNLNVLVEGVETIAHFSRLKEFGCEYFQGYFFAKPMKLADIIPYIAQDNNVVCT